MIKKKGKETRREELYVGGGGRSKADTVGISNIFANEGWKEGRGQTRFRLLVSANCGGPYHQVSLSLLDSFPMSLHCIKTC
jgi:hypothetical protein